MQLDADLVAAFGKLFLVEFAGFSLRAHLLLFGSYRIDDTRDRAPRLHLAFDNGDTIRLVAAPGDHGNGGNNGNSDPGNGNGNQGNGGGNQGNDASLGKVLISHLHDGRVVGFRRQAKGEPQIDDREGRR